jgi:DNA-binding XRE family transcriptional regulator
VEKPPPELAPALRAWREGTGQTQDQVAPRLGISRKTYVLFESGRWRVPARERLHFATALHGFTPSLAALFTADHGMAPIANPVDVAAAALAARSSAVDADAYARARLDASLYAIAEKVDVTPRQVRAIASALLASVVAANIPIAKAAEMVAAAEREMSGE